MLATGRLNLLTDVAGLAVGNAEDADLLTGVTVVLCEQAAVAGVDVRGGGPGTRETDLLRPD
ncbi:MAG: P1 family peptidase, partial [Alphaproteobacteria bacterium]